MYLFGASGHGKVIAEILESNKIKVSGFIDEDRGKENLLGYNVFHKPPAEVVKVIISIGNNRVRKIVVDSYNNFQYETAIHAAAHVSSRMYVGNGTVVMAGATINADVNIGNHSIINTNTSVDHDCIIGDFVHLSPNVALAGNVEVGEGTHVGIGACIIQGIKIGKWCTIGAGAVIIKDVPDGCTVVGNPGRIIKKQ
ncbi:acetyltransferase [Sphingobacterium sp. ML3W]|uniref:acetyltransferase n=1 Tax=Sphingobacterium sp. ML3W TaxID=1538644 RepID=UPI00249AAF92|nr:acetyltransferase [Sphingobacterium sp. ML3W]WFA78185.1 acetyltransferase [Sphingobacterium sp. ML3W]